MKKTISATTAAFLSVDVQNDFCPGGSLAIPNGDQVAPVITGYLALFYNAGAAEYASRDWHPENTEHFAKWPVHCVQNTKGAEFHPAQKLTPKTIVVSKGMLPDRDDYSASQAILEDGTSVVADLKKRGIKKVYVCGLATEYCVKSTVLELLKAGFEVVVVLDGCRGLDEANVKQAILEMEEAGAEVIDTLAGYSIHA